VEYVAGATYVPRNVDRGELHWGLTSDATNELALVYPVGYDFNILFGMQIEEGRFYDEKIPGDTSGSIIINRSVADALELEDPLGQTFYHGEDPYTIIGIMKNYIVNPLSLSGDKVIFPLSTSNPLLFVKSNRNNMQELADYLESLHEKFNPDYPFSILYMDEYTDPITSSIGEVGKIIYFFTLFGILISCMGLLGLSIFSTEQRTKEIGVRKAVGASSTKILTLVTFDFMKLILLSLLIAIPASVFLVRWMLRMFAEKISLSPGLYLLTTLIVILIAMVTISFQAIRSARSNPAASLRYE
jgi:ABC-type antimicrobial peptide transport system permease subunit